MDARTSSSPRAEIGKECEILNKPGQWYLITAVYPGCVDVQDAMGKVFRGVPKHILLMRTSDGFVYPCVTKQMRANNRLKGSFIQTQ